jgi:hypothetical protein
LKAEIDLAGIVHSGVALQAAEEDKLANTMPVGDVIRQSRQGLHIACQSPDAVERSGLPKTNMNRSFRAH